MAKQNDTGVYQKSNGYWEYRFRQKVNGKMVTRKKTTDAQGHKLKTKKEAIAAREEAFAPFFNSSRKNDDIRIRALHHEREQREPQYL